jgi:hypothetical protein
MATFAEDQQHADHIRAENQRQLDEDAACNEFFRRHAHEVLDCTASHLAIFDYFNGDAITIEALETSWREHPAFRKQLATHSPVEDRQKLEKEIAVLLSGGHSPQSVTEQIKKFTYKETEELRTWRDDLKARHDARQQTPDELRKIIQAAPPTAPPLPPEITSHQIRKVLTGTQIRELGRKYGFAAITARVNQKD